MSSKPISPDQPVLEVPGAGAGASSALRVEGLRAGYEKAEIVRGVSMTFSAGEMSAIVGPNGAGKSTLIKAFLGLVRIFDGSVYLAGTKVSGLPTERTILAGMGYVPQLNKVFPRLTVAENLEIGAFKYRRRGRRGAKDYHEALESVLTQAPQLRDRLKQRAGTMSGGEQTLLAVARGMMNRPSVLLLDEPSTALSPNASRLLWEYLGRLKSQGVCIITVEQRTREALQAADVGYVLISGQIARSGPAHELLSLDLGALFLGAHRDTPHRVDETADGTG